MKIQAYVTTEVFDRDGKRVYYRRRLSRSFVQAFMAMLEAQLKASTGSTTYPDTGNTVRTIRSYGDNFRVDAAANDATKGLVVGTGTTTVAVTDYALQTQIAHGVSSGQLSHSAVTVSGLTVANPLASLTIMRDFTNSSGGTITVREEGIYAAAYDSGTVSRKFCIIRDVESSGVPVTDGQNLRVTYTIQTST